MRTATGPETLRSRILLALLTQRGSEIVEQALPSIPGGEVVASVSELEEIRDAVRSAAPDVLVLELTSQLIRRLLLAGRLAKTEPQVKVIGMLPALHERHAGLLLRSGMLGLLHRSAGPSDLARGIEEVAAGRTYLSPGYGESLRRLYAQGARALMDSLESLSEREGEVLGLVVRGLSSREIGARLFISPRTVENHTAECCRKLNMHGTRHLLVDAYADEEGQPPFGEQ